jgi:hypothetical protein
MDKEKPTKTKKMKNILKLTNSLSKSLTNLQGNCYGFYYNVYTKSYVNCKN